MPIMMLGKKKGIMGQLKLSNNKFGMKTIEDMHDIEKNVTLIESEIEGLSHVFNTSRKELLEYIRML